MNSFAHGNDPLDGQVNTDIQNVRTVRDGIAGPLTLRADEWSAVDLLARKKDTTISVVLPARNEQDTVGSIVATITAALVTDVPLVNEVLVVDSRSTDDTAAVALAAGARVVSQDDITAGLPPMAGKGDALWAGLAASRGDLVVFLDADLQSFKAAFVVGLLGPLLTRPDIDFVKGFYHRPLLLPGDAADPSGGGRVTELVARPLLNLFWPDLAGFVQPLAGEYAGRRSLLRRLPFVTGYGVETAMMIDLVELVGLAPLAQVDLGEREHRHQSNQALGRMSAQILHTAWNRLQRRGWAATDAMPASWLTQFVPDPASPSGRRALTSDITVTERPPLATLTPPASRH